MISDFVKGRSQYNYQKNIQYGIKLHRDIDAFTDAHDATRAGKEIFRNDYRLYSGAILDIIYDYFLANDEKITWGKLDIKTPKYIIESDATIVAPLMFAYILGW
jgi:acyl carrier protein phosphodiesterase